MLQTSRGVLMAIKLREEPNPLRMDEQGVIRIANSRVILDLIILAFHQGSTPEEIYQQYPTVELADIYRTIGYYLNNKEEIDSYLAERRKKRRQLRQENEKRFPTAEIRSRLLARKQQRERSQDGV